LNRREYEWWERSCVIYLMIDPFAGSFVILDRQILLSWIFPQQMLRFDFQQVLNRVLRKLPRCRYVYLSDIHTYMRVHIHILG